MESAYTCCNSFPSKLHSRSCFFFFPRETSILPQYQVIFLFFNWNVYKLLVINTKCKLKRNVFCVYYCRSKGNSTAQIIFNTETQNISANTYSFQQIKLSSSQNHALHTETAQQDKLHLNTVKYEANALAEPHFRTAAAIILYFTGMHNLGRSFPDPFPLLLQRTTLDAIQLEISSIQ